MSRRNKNNHYHYAEKFDPRNRRMRVSDVVKAPKRAFSLAILFLLTFGLISITFAAYVGSDDYVENRNMILIKGRNTLAQREGPGGYEGLAQTGADADLASTSAVTNLRYNSGTKGWGTNSTVVGNSSGYIVVSFSSEADETFKIYHDGWNNAYFSKSDAAVALNTEYTLKTDNNYPNMTCTFAAGTYGIQITNPDTWDDLKMKIIQLYDASSYYYLDADTIWDKDGACFGAYFCNSADGTAAQWVKAVPCGDVTNSHVYRVQSPSSGNYKNLLWGRFKGGTTAAEMSFSGDKFWNKTGDQGYYPPNTVYKITTIGNGTTTAATVTVPSTAHSHTIYAYEVVRDTVNDQYSAAQRTIKNGESVDCTQADIPALTANSRANYTFDGWYRGTEADPNDEDAELVSTELTFANDNDADTTNYYGTSYYYARYTLNEMTVIFDGFGDNLNDSENVIVAYGKKPTSGDIPDTDASGYSFQYWDCGGTHYTNAQVANTAVTANRTYTAKYNIDAPTLNISSNQNFTCVANASSPLNIGGTVTSDADPDDITVSGSYAWDSDHSADQPDGYLSNVTLNTSNGEFSATMPGVYYLTFTGQVENTDTLNGTASTTVSFTVTVYPEVPVFDISLIGKVNDADLTGVDEDHAWMILLGAHYHFEATVSNANSNYTYEWSKDNGSTWYAVNSIPDSWTAEYRKATNANSPGMTINTNGNGSTLTFADNRQTIPTLGTSTFSLKVRATKNGVSQTSNAAVSKWYFIERIIHSYRLMPMHERAVNEATELITQKIFSVSTAAQAGLEAVYSSRVNYIGFTTYSKVSTDNLTYTDEQTLSQTSADQTLTDLTTTLNNFFNYTGVKYLKLSIIKDDISDSTAYRHTTVGTADETTAKPFYFIDGIANDSINGRLMVFWADSHAASGYSFQTAQDVYKGNALKGTRYRVNIPSDVSSIVFAVAKEEYYGLPEYNSATGQFTFNSNSFYARTDQISVNENTNTFTLNAKTVDAVSVMSGSTGTFVPES